VCSLCSFANVWVSPAISWAESVFYSIKASEPNATVKAKDYIRVSLPKFSFMTALTTIASGFNDCDSFLLRELLSCLGNFAPSKSGLQQTNLLTR